MDIYLLRVCVCLNCSFHYFSKKTFVVGLFESDAFKEPHNKCFQREIQNITLIFLLKLILIFCLPVCRYRVTVRKNVLINFSCSI